MLEREKEAGLLPDPTWRLLVTKDGLPLWGSAASGEVQTFEAPQPVMDIRGGFFCDEPVGMLVSHVHSMICMLSQLVRDKMTLAWVQ